MITETDKQYRHDINDDETATQCGISVDEPGAASLPIACGCGHPLCELPITCPACLAVTNNTRN